MTLLAALVPGLPLASAALLMFLAQRLPPRATALIGAGSVGAAAVAVALLASLLEGPTTVRLWTWLDVDGFAPGIAFAIDGLTLVMMAVITGVGFFIHLYSVEFMAGDDGYARYFACMNLFVACMLALVMADNLLLLYLGWEGVGMCSYLLIGFWYRDAANGAAARKAFIVTRVGDLFFALGLFLLYTELGTLEIAALVDRAQILWRAGDGLPLLATLLLLGGALGKSAQLPLHSWLPDAMAGPTPVSALIHAATMVTAGVYLIARLHGLFELAPVTLALVAWLGLATALLAAVTALTQSDIKRILAYSTLSQIGYMFVAVGAGAYSVAVFHLVSHAFFKALLFLAAGAVTHCLHHEHNIFRMGGLARRLPLVFAAFLVGTAALSALPLTVGYSSKEAILGALWLEGGAAMLLWLGALAGALLTSIYSFRLLFIAFLGEVGTEPDRQPGWYIALPLAVLLLASLLGGLLQLPLAGVLPAETGHAPWAVALLGTLVPLLGLAVAVGLFTDIDVPLPRLAHWQPTPAWRDFFRGGWGFDGAYARLLVAPFLALAQRLRADPADRFSRAAVWLNRRAHYLIISLQNGQLRRYTGALGIGLALLLAAALGARP